MKTSMSGKGNCFDNAPMESFWGMLKQELIYQCHFSTRQEARQSITEYIEIFYNRQRLQSKLGFLSPAAFVQRYYAGLLVACVGLVSTIDIRPHLYLKKYPAFQEQLVLIYILIL
jgi:putative transposase